jgi:hypothetical protein
MLSRRFIPAIIVVLLALQVAGTGAAVAGEKTTTYTNQTWQYKISYPASWRRTPVSAADCVSDTCVSADLLAVAPDNRAGVFSYTYLNPSGDIFVDLSPAFRASLQDEATRVDHAIIQGPLKFGTRKVNGHLFSTVDESVGAGSNTGHLTIYIIAYPNHIYAFFGMVLTKASTLNDPGQVLTRASTLNFPGAVSTRASGLSASSSNAKRETAEIKASLNSIVFE